MKDKRGRKFGQFLFQDNAMQWVLQQKGGDSGHNECSNHLKKAVEIPWEHCDNEGGDGNYDDDDDDGDDDDADDDDCEHCN